MATLEYDFVAESYADAVGTGRTFDQAVKFSRASNATMVDSDGLIKWAPHNLFPNSTFAGNTDGGGKTYTSVGNVGFVEFTGVTARVYDILNMPAVAGASYTIVFDVTEDATVTEDTRIFARQIGTISGDTTKRTSDIIGGKVTVNFTAGATETVRFAFGLGVFGNASGTLTFSKATSYRSDLGGMVDNPETGNSYVPTTGTVRYLSRLGQHVWNGSEWVNKGLLIESEARTNLLLNSGTLSTQSVTVTAEPHTLHLTGTGTITLSGASTAGPLVGTGAGEQNRVSLTFTPTSGSLTLTVSGTVTNAQLEAGATPSSYIPTTGASATRAAETLTIAAANFPSSTTPFSIVQKSEIDLPDGFDISVWDRSVNPGTRIVATVDTRFSLTGSVSLLCRQSYGAVTASNQANITGEGLKRQVNLGARVDTSAFQLVFNGTGSTAGSYETGPLNLSSSAFNIYAGHGQALIQSFKAWDTDIGETQLASETNPAANSTDNVTPTGITTTPTLGTPAVGQVHALTATGIETTPALGTPAVGQTQNLTATGIQTTPTLGTPEVGQVHNLAAVGITTTPTLGTPTAGETSNTDSVTPLGLTTTPTVGTPAVGQAHNLTAVGIETTPVLGRPTAGSVAGVDSVTPTGITVTPTVGTPQIGQIHALSAVSIDVIPELGIPAVGQVHALVAVGVQCVPVLGRPVAGDRAPDFVLQIPSSRLFRVHPEIRIFKVKS